MMAAAGYFSSAPDDRKYKTKTLWAWVGWSALVGAVLAIGLTVSGH
jgi:hypothetical protein